jgi:hypothetical protein
MLRSGLPAAQAILYFVETEDPGELMLALRKWQRSIAVRRAMASLLEKPWTEMSAEEAMRAGLEIHYRQLATLLHSENYIDADPQTKGKMDAARVAIEAKLAGQAGKMNALEQFYDDLRTGRVKALGGSPAAGRPS